jgi:hypothetical protein
MNWLYVIAFILFFAWFDGINAGNAEKLALEELKGARQAFLVAEALNGKSLQVGEHIVDCKPRRK